MPKKLLLADDSITIQKVIGITFANEDFALTTVDNGVDAIQTAKRVKPDLILADVVMPGKNGYEVCEYVKHDPELRGTPVLLLAGTFESFDEAEMARVGADGYITKPFESQTLIDKVHELTSHAQQTPGRPAAKAPVLRPPAKQAAPSPLPARPEAGAPSGSDDFNLDDFSPFEEVAAGAAAPGAEMAAAEPAAGWDVQNGTGDEDVWDLSDFEPGTEGSTSEQAEALFAEAEAAVDAGAEGTAGVEGEQTFDFGVADPTEAVAEEDPFATTDDAFAATEAAPAEDGFASEDDGFGGNGEFAGEVSAEAAEDAMELTDLEEVTELDGMDPVEDDPLAAAPETAAEDLVSPDAAEGWQVEPIAQVKAPGRSAAAVAAAPVAMGALASRVKQAAEGLTGELSAAGVSLPAHQVEAIVTRVAREVIEAVAWEVVPDLCEELITAEIRRITGAK